MANQMCVCRIERISGDGGGIGTETKREYSDGRVYSPNNVTRERSHLNRQIIGKGDRSKHGGNYIVSAINNRIANAELKRKVGSNQCRALIAYLSGTHDQMMKIVNQGLLDDWIMANVNWLEQTFGEENIVSVDLHMDEYTPHLHAVIVPITSQPRIRRKREGATKYNTSPRQNRLCADDIMTKSNLINFQNTYAEAMQSYGLSRGVNGSKARHQSMNTYYRLLQDKIPEAEHALDNISKDIKKKEQESTALTIKNQIKKKKIDSENGTAIIRGLAKMVGITTDDVVKEKDKIIEQLKKELAQERKERRTLKKQIDNMLIPLSVKERNELQSQIDKLNESIKSKNDIIKQLHYIVDSEPQRIDKARSDGYNEAAIGIQNWRESYENLQMTIYKVIDKETEKINKEKEKITEEQDAFMLSMGKWLNDSWPQYNNAIKSINNIKSGQWQENDINRINAIGKPFNWSNLFAKMIGLTAAFLFNWDGYETQKAIADIKDIFSGRFDRIISRHL